MLSDSPHSPGAAPPEADDEQPVPQAEDAGSEKADKSKREFLLFYSKKYYRVPPECVIVDYGRSVIVRDGKHAGELHECKSHPKWLSDGVHTRHIIKLKVEGRVGFYVTFQIEGEESDDVCVVRALHKSIAKKFYEMWQKEWSDEKRAKFAELVADEPLDESQMSPIAHHWKMVDAPAKVLYIRPPGKKKGDEADEAPTKKKAKLSGSKKPMVEEPPDADDDDEQSSAAQSTALVTMPQGGGTASSTGAANFFMQTPGTRARIHTPCIHTDAHPLCSQAWSRSTASCSTRWQPRTTRSARRYAARGAGESERRGRCLWTRGLCCGARTRSDRWR